MLISFILLVSANTKHLEAKKEWEKTQGGTRRGGRRIHKLDTK